MSNNAKSGDVASKNPNLFFYKTIDSTNAEAMRHIAGGMRGPAWFAAETQTAGRGRHARAWISPPGNLYATFALTVDVDPASATELSFVAGLAAFDTMAALADRDASPGLTLKWPNDIMLGGAKAAGILLESMRHPHGNGLAIALGTGINLVTAPQMEGRAVASLARSGEGAWRRALDELIAQTALWFAVWDGGAGFARVRAAWLLRAHAVGDALSVHLNGAILHGTFQGLDERGALLIETRTGRVKTITAGDVFAAGS